MSTFKKCPEAVAELCRDVLCAYPSHKPLLDGRVKIDLVFAYGERDDNGELKSPALKLRGQPARGIARKIKLKDRVLGRGDAEIALDGDWWESAGLEERRALLDHELYHFIVETDSNGKALTDDITRPKIAIRRHDYEFGWFAEVARRHGVFSGECQQAKKIMDEAGQFFWPGLVAAPDPAANNS